MSRFQKGSTDTSTELTSSFKILRGISVPNFENGPNVAVTFASFTCARNGMIILVLRVVSLRFLVLSVLRVFIFAFGFG